MGSPHVFATISMIMTVSKLEKTSNSDCMFGAIPILFLSCVLFHRGLGTNRIAQRCGRAETACVNEP